MKIIKTLVLFCAFISIVYAANDGGRASMRTTQSGGQRRHLTIFIWSILKLLSIFWILSVATVIYLSFQTATITKLDTCEAEADANAPNWVFTLAADMCTLYPDNDGVYHLESNKFHESAEWHTDWHFVSTDRPMQLEKTEPTAEWFANFDERFAFLPNSALTCTKSEGDTSKDVVISVFAEPYVKEGEIESEATYGYELKQSIKQEGVLSLRELMEGKESVTFDNCVIFVDAPENFNRRQC